MSPTIPFRVMIFCLLSFSTVFAQTTRTPSELDSVRTRPRTTTTDCGCQQLRQVVIPQVTITTAECVPAGLFTPPGSRQTIIDLPSFCRVIARLAPARNSNIYIEVWLPTTNWNERFLGTGNGGGAGKIDYEALANGLRRGFATANTDMGTSPDANEAVGHPERWIDFGYRATHEMTAIAKIIAQAYYKKAFHHAYFVGCSTGGQQALMECQRYPDDYDGILAGAPANNRTHLHTGFVWNYKATNQFAGSAFLPEEKLTLITKTVLKACAGKDGGAPGDNFLTDPSACPFDPKMVPRCPEGIDNATCLTQAQVTALKKIYAGPVNPRTGERIYTPLPVGSELGIDYQQNPNYAPSSLFYQYKWVFGANFDYTTFDFDRDQARLDSVLAPILNANDPDLDRFKKRGGKLLMFTGTADPLVPYQDALHYYNRVVEKQGDLQKTLTFFRYFLIPGMGHCGGGPGLNDCGQTLSLHVAQDSDHDMLTALINWVERGTAPDRLIATAYKDGVYAKGIRFQRPIYPYPKLPKFVGNDPNSPDSYQGVNHQGGNVLMPADKYIK